jgi:hypothetical protein
LNGGGGRTTAGLDDSATDTSAVLASHGIGSLEVPPYRGNEAAWAKMVSCVRTGFAPFSVAIVTERPTHGPYIMAMIGGRPEMLGYGRDVSGISPFTGKVIEGAIVYIFERAMRGQAQSVCDSVLHEVGHALGLEHAYLCEDPMSYLSGCGPKRFQDARAWCGEFEPRACGGGGKQNSFQQLAANIGLRGGVEATLDRDESAVASAGDPLPISRTQSHAFDNTAPVVQVLSPESTMLTSGKRVRIVVFAEDESGVADVELAWSTPQQTFFLRCDSMPSGIPAACHREGNRFFYTMTVGIGERAFAARAVDRAGNVSVTETRVLVFVQAHRRSSSDSP